MNQDRIILSSIWRSGIIAAGFVMSLALPAIAQVQTSLGRSFIYSTTKTQRTTSLYSSLLYSTTPDIDSPTLYAHKHGNKKRRVAPPPPMPEIQLSPEAQRILCEQFPLNSRARQSTTQTRCSSSSAPTR